MTDFADVYQLHVDRVYRYVYFRVRDRVVAEDVTSEVFLKALQAIGRYEDRGQMLAWLLQIARRTIIDHYRQRTMENIDELDLDDGSFFEERVMRRLEVRRIGELMGDLPARQREAMVLFFCDDLSQKEIAASMGTTRGAVQLLMHRGMTALREAA